MGSGGPNHLGVNGATGSAARFLAPNPSANPAGDRGRTRAPASPHGGLAEAHREPSGRATSTDAPPAQLDPVRRIGHLRPRVASGGDSPDELRGIGFLARPNPASCEPRSFGSGVRLFLEPDAGRLAAHEARRTLLQERLRRFLVVVPREAQRHVRAPPGTANRAGSPSLRSSASTSSSPAPPSDPARFRGRTPDPEAAIRRAAPPWSPHLPPPPRPPTAACPASAAPAPA